MSFLGAFRVLFIEDNGVFYPVACLEEQNISEEVDMLLTTTRETDGWETSRPVTQRYTLDFVGRQVNTIFPGGAINQISYDRLRIFKRERELINWRIDSTDGNQLREEGQGYINTLSEAAVVNEFVSFSGSIVGFGIISPFDLEMVFDPANGALLNLTQGAALSAITITFSERVIKSIMINGIITNTTTMATLDIEDANTVVTGGGFVLEIDTTGFFATAAVYTVEIEAGAVTSNDNIGYYSLDITTYHWSFKVRHGDWLAADWDNSDWFTN